MGQTNRTVDLQESRNVEPTFVQVKRTEIYEGQLVLVNRDHPIRKAISSDKLLPLSVSPSLKELQDGMLLEKSCLQHLISLLDACQGMEDIVAVSGYRTKEEQAHIYESSWVENGPEYTASYVALPDQSEHQTGLAIDVGKADKDVDFIAPSFPDSGIYRSFKQLAAQFGFIQRYKEGKEQITNIACEPWHFRYVGYPHAVLMEKNEWCLEEYIDFLQSVTNAGERFRFENESLRVEIYYVPAEEGPYTTVPIVSCEHYRISGNNRDGFIISAFTGKGYTARA
ncbi:D-alanyl-D-alanine carboxypeptidase family protein [Paenibacillus sp. LPE1-1-1.1]|uniref:D-alanyl-D-alanine carboxypeptidase family protein n=1 Tax=Paenibacillus sp. LPE1-1-1.1 TaxID=3135230 RepID=UPI003448025C